MLNLSVYLVTKPIDKTELYFEKLEEALKGGVSILQWREKGQKTRVLYDQASAVQRLAKEYKIPFIINDRLDIALALGADGLHIGQDDLPASVARKLLGPDKILGVSASTIEEALQAEAGGADYLGVGSVYPTKTKADATLITKTTFQAICEAVKIPVVAIGGITLERVPDIKKLGAAGVAVVSAIWNSPSPQKAAIDFASANEA